MASQKSLLCANINIAVTFGELTASYQFQKYIFDSEPPGLSWLTPFYLRFVPQGKENRAISHNFLSKFGKSDDFIFQRSVLSVRRSLYDLEL